MDNNDWFDYIIENPEDVIKEYEVVYDVYGEGMIEGEFIQIVLEGQDATAVFAIPEDGWYFEFKYPKFLLTLAYSPLYPQTR